MYRMTPVEEFIRNLSLTKSDELEYSEQIPAGKRIKKMAEFIRQIKVRAKEFEENRLEKLEKKGDKPKKETR